MGQVGFVWYGRLLIQNNEWNATSVILFRVIFSSTAEVVDSDDKEEYSEAEGSRYD